MFSLLFHKNRERWIASFSKMAMVPLQQYVLKPIRYRTACRELRVFTETFLLEMGIKWRVAERMATVFVTMLEHDDAYLLRVQDLADATTGEKMRNNPRKEVKRLLKLLSERDPRVSMNKKFGGIAKLFSLAMYLPKIRKAYNKAMDSIDWSKIQMDEADHYHALRWNLYDVGGKSFEDRTMEFLAIHENNLPTSYQIQS